MEALATNSRRRDWWGLAVTLLWLLAYFAARFVLEIEGLGSTARVLVALIPVVPFVGFLVAVARGIGRLDELERRVHLEALAFAFPGALLLLMTLGLLEIAIELPREDLSYRHVWPIVVAMYFAGLMIARRRYQ